MTDQTNADLIAEANRLLAENQWTSGWGVESLAARLVDALEAADQEIQRQREINRRAERQTQAEEQRADEAEAAEKRWEDRAYTYSADRDQLAAVVEKVRAEVEGESGWFRHRAGRVLDILATAPADALREVKSDVWDECVNAEARAAVTASPRIKNPYRKEQS